VKSEAFFHLTANISYPLMVLLSRCCCRAMIVRFYQGWFQMLVIDLPLFLASTCFNLQFLSRGTKRLRPKTWLTTFLYMPFVMATGIGTACATHKPCLKLSWARNRILRARQIQIEGKSGTFAAKKYKNKAGWMPYFEVAWASTSLLRWFTPS